MCIYTVRWWSLFKIKEYWILFLYYAPFFFWPELRLPHIIRNDGCHFVCVQGMLAFIAKYTWMIYILLFVVYRLLMKDEKTTAAVRSFLLLWWWLFGYILSIKKRAPAAACWMLTSFYLLSWGLIFTTSSWNISLNMMKMDSPRLYKKNGPLYKNYSIECDEPWIPYAWKGFFFSLF